MPKSVDLNLGILGKPAPDKPIRKIIQVQNDNVNLEDVLNFIQNKDLPDDAKEFLIKKAKGMPHGALHTFSKNYKRYLSTRKTND